MNLLQCVPILTISTDNRPHSATTDSEDTSQTVIDEDFYQKKNYRLIIQCLNGGKSFFSPLCE